MLVCLVMHSSIDTTTPRIDLTSKYYEDTSSVIEDVIDVPIPANDFQAAWGVLDPACHGLFIHTLIKDVVVLLLGFWAAGLHAAPNDCAMRPTPLPSPLPCSFIDAPSRFLDICGHNPALVSGCRRRSRPATGL